MTPTATQLYDVLEATWPPAAICPHGPWDIREGRGGGKRVSAATARTPTRAEELPLAEEAMRALGQPALFMIRDGDGMLDRMLAANGYRIIDPVMLYAAPVETLTTEPIPRVTAFEIWEPLAIMEEIWAKGGIGPARLAVMHRVAGPKTALLGRQRDQPAAAAFVALNDRIAMLHALEVLPPHRQSGMGGWMMRAAAFWAARQSATHLTLAVTRENAAANALYASLGMTAVGQYHYRIKDTAQ